MYGAWTASTTRPSSSPIPGITKNGAHVWQVWGSSSCKYIFFMFFCSTLIHLQNGNYSDDAITTHHQPPTLAPGWRRGGLETRTQMCLEPCHHWHPTSSAHRHNVDDGVDGAWNTTNTGTRTTKGVRDASVSWALFRLFFSFFLLCLPWQRQWGLRRICVLSPRYVLLSFLYYTNTYQINRLRIQQTRPRYFEIFFLTTANLIYMLFT